MSRPTLRLAKRIDPARIKQAVARIVARYARMLPAALERLHLQWALYELQRHHPMHADLPWIVNRINELERA